MDFLKALFESGALTWEEFSKAVTEKGFKLADLSTGNYVAKKKYDDDLGAKDTQISELNTQLTTRDTDLSDLKAKLETAGTDNKTKVTELTAQITKLQGDYDSVKSDYESKLEKQANEFAVREFASTKKFTSNAAKRDFINEMIRENLKMKDGTLLGAEDFVKVYAEANSDAFVVDTPAEPEQKPTFVNPTTPTPPPSDNAFLNVFNFSGVRPKSN
jgi:chromosome segregation ATPase